MNFSLVFQWFRPWTGQIISWPMPKVKILPMYLSIAFLSDLKLFFKRQTHSEREIRFPFTLILIRKVNTILDYNSKLISCLWDAFRTRVTSKHFSEKLNFLITGGVNSWKTKKPTEHYESWIGWKVFWQDFFWISHVNLWLWNHLHRKSLRLMILDPKIIRWQILRFKIFAAKNCNKCNFKNLIFVP